MINAEMRHQDMFAQPGYLIRRLHQRSTAEFAAATAEYGITQIQLSILLVVEEFPGIDATRISELIGSDRATIGQALARMQEKQLIRRKTGTQDKRTKRLVITEAGRTLAREVARVVPSIGPGILRGLTASERETFLRLLIKLVAANEGETAVGRDDAVAE
jgi:DNA-binding MarR family transcriptional regulator